MVTTEAFVLETYLAAYAPKSLTTSAWGSTREQVLDLVRQLAPATEAEAKNLLGALTRYLARMCPGGEADVSTLTADGIDRFVALERASGAMDSTLGRIGRHLRLLLGALSGSPATSRRPRKGGSRPPFDPVTDLEWEDLQGVGARMAEMGDSRLVDFLCVGQSAGFEAQALGTHGWGPVEITGLREAVGECASVNLQLHRLRHRWMLEALSQPAPLSSLISRHGLTRRDLERVVQGFTVQESSNALLRSA